ncbi:MAG TPA: flagellar assembly protein FliW [Firmicutes bacterium]|nr:flagellar assembly protein FliW [Bacillota bacterium]
MELQTKIGALQVKEEEIINFPMGLLGFGDLHRYIVVKKEDSLFSFLQSVDEPDLTFVLIMPELVVGDYSVKLQAEEIELLQIKSPQDGSIYAIVTVPENVAAMTVNLQAPIVINTKDRYGAQIVIPDGPYHTKHNLLAEMQKNEFLRIKSSEAQEKQPEVQESV